MAKSIITDNAEIRVSNVNCNSVAVATAHREYLFEPATFDDKGNIIPTYHFFSFGDLEFINSRSPVFRAGILTFDSEQQESIYTALKIPNWEEILFNDTIDDIILSPTAEKLQRILNIKDINVFERVRGRIATLMGADHDVSNRVVDLVNARLKELNRGMTRSNISVEKVKRVAKAATVEDINSVKNENDLLKKQMAEVMEQLKQMKTSDVQTSNDVVSASTFSEQPADEQPDPADNTPEAAPKKTRAKAPKSE